MIRQILTAAVIASGVLYPVTAFSKVTTCELSDHRLTGRFKGGNDNAAFVKSRLGSAFRVDTTKPSVLLRQIGDHWHKIENVSVSRTKKFTLYKYKKTGKFTDNNRNYTFNFAFKIYNDGSGSAGMQQSPSTKYVYMEAKAKCDTL